MTKRKFKCGQVAFWKERRGHVQVFAVWHDGEKIRYNVRNTMCPDTRVLTHEWDVVEAELRALTAREKG
jgi:hypothetical protein